MNVHLFFKKLEFNINILILVSCLIYILNRGVMNMFEF